MPISHKIKRHQFKLLLILVFTGLFYHIYTYTERDSHTPLNDLLKKVDPASPKKGLLNTQAKVKVPPVSHEAIAPSVPTSIGPIANSVPVPVRTAQRMHRLPPPSTSKINFRPPKYAGPQRGDEKNVLVKYTDEDYATMEIIFDQGPGTRLNGIKKLDLLPPVSHLPRKPKFPVDKIKQLPNSDELDTSSIPRIQALEFKETRAEKRIRLERLDKVKETFLISWNQYKKYAWGRDEVMPVSLIGSDPFAGWAATLVDALDTLLIMDLKSEFREAVEVIKDINFATTFRGDIPLFETVIRYLGGLLAAYDLSNEPILLRKATELGDNLMGAFDTPNHMPLVSFLWTEADQKYSFRGYTRSSLAEIGSLSVEFTRLAQLTGNSTYFDAIDRITTAIYELAPTTGIPYLFPSYLDASGCQIVPLVEVIREKKLSAGTRQLNKDTVTPVAGHIVKDIPLAEPRTKRQALNKVKTPSEEKLRADQERILAEKYGAKHATSVESSMEDLTTPEPVKPTDKSRNDVPEASKQTKDTSYNLQKREGTEKPKKGRGAIKRVIKAYGNVYSTIIGCLKAAPLTIPHTTVQRFTLGGLTDSTYEYFTKEYILLQGTDERYKELYTKMVESATKYNIFRPLAEGDPDILLSGNINKYEPNFYQQDNDVSHLGCYIGGMFALGGKVFNRPHDVEQAAKLTQGCVWAYNSTRSGVMPESFRVRRCPVQLSTETSPPLCHFNLSTVELESVERERLWTEDMVATGLLEAGATYLSPTTNGRLPRMNEVEDGMGGTKLPYMGAFDLPRSFLRIDPRYLLRPEALESVFYMYRVSGDKVWQDQGWDMFMSIIELTKVTIGDVGTRKGGGGSGESGGQQVSQNDDDDDAEKVIGFSSVNDATDPRGKSGNLRDEAESFWMAETLKYAYLLFSEPGVVSLDDYVFNTEAHPLLRPDVDVSNPEL